MTPVLFFSVNILCTDIENFNFTYFFPSFELCFVFCDDIMLTDYLIQEWSGAKVKWAKLHSSNCELLDIRFFRLQKMHFCKSFFWSLTFHDSFLETVFKNVNTDSCSIFFLPSPRAKALNVIFSKWYFLRSFSKYLRNGKTNSLIFYFDIKLIIFRNLWQIFFSYF